MIFYKLGFIGLVVSTNFVGGDVPGDPKNSQP